MTKNVKSGVYTRVRNNEKQEVPFTYFTNLRESEKIAFVNDVLSLLIDTDTLLYRGTIKNLVFDYILIDKFTDVDLSEFNDKPNTIDLIYDFLTETNIVEIVKTNAESGLVDLLYQTVEDNIAYRTGINHNSFGSAIARFFNTLETQLKGVNVEETMNMLKGFSEAFKGFDGITPEALWQGYKDSGLFNERLDNVMAARSNSNNVIPITKG